MKTWIFLSLAALSALCVAQQDCARGACYPPTGDLLLGREQNLRASSTCGLMGSEVVCAPHGQWKMKCCPCDSRNPAAYNAHTIQNVMSSAGPNRWWQSKKDVSPVTLQLDLNGIYHLETVLLSFKGPRPDALVIERTRDYGGSWEPVLYMATDCPSTFPQVSTSFPGRLQDTYCYTLPSTADQPYRDQKVHFYPLHQFSNIDLPNEYKIEVASGFTGLRVNLTRLGPVPSLPGRGLSQFYALREMKVMGSCFCHGHTERCRSQTNTQVGGVCDCQHNTAGVNCERCDDFYNDLPWRPAESGNTHTCKRCDCNNHSDRCHFDPRRYEETGRRSGGVCDGCSHHTTGPNCERCEQNYYPNPLSDMRSPDACLRCLCDPAGSENGGQCDATGVCVCKANVEGDRCDRCKDGHYNLDANNPRGCSKCSCSSVGSVSGACNQLTGQCVCRANTEGLACDRCAAGYWNPSSPNGCQPCDCDRNNARSATCDQRTGQCVCRPGIGGRTCSGCPDNTYGDPLIGCRPCDCEFSGTEPGGCDKRTGLCRCKSGITGPRCDVCARGYCASFPECPACPSCFFSMNTDLQELTLGLERLSNSLLSSGGRPTSSDSSRRIQTLQDTLALIQESVSVPPQSSRALTEALQRLNTLRSQMEGLRVDLPSAPRGRELERELDELQSLLSSLSLQYFSRRDTFTSTTGSTNASDFYAIQKSYNNSTDAVKRADATIDTLKKTEGVRENALSGLDALQPGNTKDLQNLKTDLETRPNLTPAATKVCGSDRVEPCTPERCAGDLCPPDGAPPCGAEDACTGALPNANKAFQDADEVKAKLQDLNDKITQAAEQIQEAEDSANRVRLSTDKLADQIKQVRADVDGDLKDTKDFINTLRDFLSEPHSDPEQVQRVCEAVLEARLPMSLDQLKQKLKDLQDLMVSVPDSSSVLTTSGPQLENARRLLDAARDTRDAAFGIQQDGESLLKTMNENENIFDDLEDKIRQSVDIANDVKKDVERIEDLLVPAEQGIVGISGLMDEIRPLVDTLRNDAATGTALANEAQDQANSAEDEADRAAQALEALKDEFERMKRAAAENTQAGEDGARLLKLQEEAESLMTDTSDIMKALIDKEASIRQRATEMEENGSRLTGLDAQVEKLRDDIRYKVTSLNMCQG
ncbi:laminin subunit beta-3 [Pimephales promelas]|uniref:laminin subunit beta-3 n=1 Tax=Pimephales promelas TaxID=90988 RepID=UPI001955B4C6|nr:laminin subunit beta-3 [Pimephales promelas]XP_039538073.1 laminin subunit beta-3 [Pimephales promelas]